MTKDTSKKIKVSTKSDNQRLDIFLSERLNITRSQAQKMTKESLIEINEQLPKKPGSKIKKGDEITIKKPKKNKPVKNNKQVKIEGKKFTLKDIKIISENKDYIIINKPAGLLVHPTEKDEKNTLSKVLLKKYPELKNIGEDPIRPGIIHRLDRDASGLMIVTRTQKMFNHLKKQFKNRTINKEYFVLVHGRTDSENGRIDFPIARSKNGERMAALPSAPNGTLRDMDKTLKGGHRYKKSRDAFTEFWIEKKYINFTLLRVKIHTGRTHQIRVHMLAYNSPVVGDNIYYQKKQKRNYDKKCGRLFLHSNKLGFKDLNDKNQEFTSKLPKNLSEFLQKIK